MIHYKPVFVCVRTYMYMHTTFLLSAPLSKIKLLLVVHFQQIYSHLQIRIGKKTIEAKRISTSGQLEAVPGRLGRLSPYAQ